MPHTLSQDPSIPALSLTGEDGLSCPIYTPEESISTPLRSVQADSMLDNGDPKPDDSIDSPSPDRRPFLLNNKYTTPEMSWDDMNWDVGELGYQEARFKDGHYTNPPEEEHRNTVGGRQISKLQKYFLTNRS